MTTKMVKILKPKVNKKWILLGLIYIHSLNEHIHMIQNICECFNVDGNFKFVYAFSGKFPDGHRDITNYH